MWTLTRSVRLNIPSRLNCRTPTQNPNERPAGTGFSGMGSLAGLASHFQFDVSCRGIIDPRTSYVRDIKHIDNAVIALLLPALTEPDDPQGTSPGRVLLAAIPRIDERLGGVLQSVRWRITPYHSIEMSPARTQDHSRALPPTSVVLRQRFDFCAAHRLHNPELSDEENRQRFGKCNNPAGHGHNYVFEPAVRSPLDARGATPFSLEDLEQLCGRLLTQRFDHKHLNVDTPEFSAGSGVLPTVENISKVFYELLAPAITARCPAARLESMTVWETDRTSSTYPG